MGQGVPVAAVTTAKPSPGNGSHATVGMSQRFGVPGENLRGVMYAYRPGTEAHKTALVNAVFEYVACQIPEVVEHDATARASLQASAVSGASIEATLLQMIRDLHKAKQDVQESFSQYIEANGMPRIVVTQKESGR